MLQVPDQLFACREHWWKLSAPVRLAIYATAGKSLLDRTRREVIAAAREEWGRPVVPSTVDGIRPHLPWTTEEHETARRLAEAQPPVTREELQRQGLLPPD